MPPLMDAHRSLSQAAKDESMKREAGLMESMKYGNKQLHEITPCNGPFPIRTSQATVHAGNQATNTIVLPHQHLRRKTPNGTLDRGYDGSADRQALGEPPLKQIALPASLSTNPYGSFYSIGQMPSRHYEISWQESPSNVQSPSTGMALLHHVPLSLPAPTSTKSNPQSRYFPDAQSKKASSPFHNPAISATSYFTPTYPPQPPNNWQMSPDYTNQGIWSDHNNFFMDSARTSLSYYVQSNQIFNMNDRFPKLNAMGPFNFQPTGYHPQQDASMKPRSIDINFDAQSQHQFKERVLERAHRSYVSLLGHIHSSKRKHIAEDQRHLDQSKYMGGFPKPPKPCRTHFTVDFSTNNYQVRAQTISQEDHYSHQYSVPLQGSAKYHKHVSQCEQSAQYEKILQGSNKSGIGASHESTAFVGSTPASAPASGIGVIVEARASLDILHNLCEQTSWQWPEGMLLAGCLYYAFEEFKDALRCFSRIVALDNRHIEAIANIGATLYCMQRHTEAEQQWLHALNVQPDYLDAAEHLVGLLYKSRSREAIGIICQVQQALKHSPDGKHLHTSGQFLTDAQTTSGPSGSSSCEPNLSHTFPLISNTQRNAGYGSSGYALSANENGRILALIHAKGTMLYGLKQIAHAADAFEEAVLISTAHCIPNIASLICRIRIALSSGGNSSMQKLDDSGPQALQTLLLTPDKASQTAELVFGGDGSLPGLIYKTDMAQKRAAVQTTSNALLSLAKIYQDTLANGSLTTNPIRSPSGVGDILALYYLSLSLQESPSTANNVGILLAGVQQCNPRPTGRSAQMTRIPGIVPGSGLELALSYYYYGLKLDPKHVHLHTNLGSLLKDVGQLDLAIQMYERAVACDGSFDIALTNLANAVKDKGRVNEAITYYKRAIAANPNFAEAVCGLFTALNSVCDWRGRGGVLLNSGKYDRWHVSADGLLVDSKISKKATGLAQGVVTIIRRQLEDAASWGRNTLSMQLLSYMTKQLQPYITDESFDIHSELSKWRGDDWEGSRLVRILERATRIALRVWYREQYVLRRKPRVIPSRLRLPPELSVPSAPTVLPFHTFTCPLSASEIRMISQRNALRISCSTLRATWLPDKLYPPPPPPNPHLHVGYVSSDFNNHPLAHLMQSVFGFHNKERVQSYCYATTPSDKSAYRLQIEQESPFFRDASSWSLEQLTAQIVKDEIHILVNLNGYTRGARNEIFAARPAPLQMSFMGYAGTLGAEWCDYILADSIAIPTSALRPSRKNITIEDVFRDESESVQGNWLYSENIIFCRDTFFCCDHAQSCSAGERNMSWSDEERRRWAMRKELFPNISDDTIILANFNQLYKIEPTIFRSWLQILARVPRAILWLLRFPEAGEANLRRTALNWAGPEIAARLVFTDVAPKGQHIARARICDLFLDTPECNAHTTAADVLWSSTPLLTLPRYPYKMCSRMAASILKGALPKSKEGDAMGAELIVADEFEYEQRAIQLASDLEYISMASGCYRGVGRLAEMRRLLWDSKWTCGLFDTRRWVRDVEDAYEEAWKRWIHGQDGDIYL